MSQELPKKQIKPSEFKKYFEELGATKTAKIYGISRVTAWKLAKNVKAVCKKGRPSQILFKEE
jgi:histone deacetylase complex regulatory component SIN3